MKYLPLIIVLTLTGCHHTYTTDCSKLTLGPSGLVLNGYAVFSGSCRTFHDNNHTKIKSVINFVDGVEHGLHTEFYPIGQLKMEAHLVQGEYDGDYTEYHSNGVVRLRTTYVKGLGNGNYREIYQR